MRACHSRQTMPSPSLWRAWTSTRASRSLSSPSLSSSGACQGILASSATHPLVLAGVLAPSAFLFIYLFILTFHGYTFFAPRAFLAGVIARIEALKTDIGDLLVDLAEPALAHHSSTPTRDRNDGRRMSEGKRTTPHRSPSAATLLPPRTPPDVLQRAPSEPTLIVRKTP